MKVSEALEAYLVAREERERTRPGGLAREGADRLLSLAADELDEAIRLSPRYSPELKPEKPL